MIGSVVREFLPEKDILTYLEAILRVYNLNGRRDNKFKARIKILVKSMGVEAFTAKVEQEWERIRDTQMILTDKEVNRAKSFFTEPDYETFDEAECQIHLATQTQGNRAFGDWLRHNVHPHRVPGYRALTLSLKQTGVAPGDITDQQLEAIADLCEQYSFGEVRTTHQQNIVLADVKIDDLFSIWQAATDHGFATANIGTATDMICCPGGDFCSLANAKSIPVAEAIQREFDDIDYLYDLGNVELNISGCMNACGHHHIGHIGILGVDKKGEEFYQVQLGGSQTNDASLAKVLGPSFSRADMPRVVKDIFNVYTERREDGEEFLQTYRRVGIEPFKERVYAKAD